MARMRNDYMRNEGFALAANVGHGFMEDLAAYAARKIDEGPITDRIPRLPGSSGSLAGLTARFQDNADQMETDLARAQWEMYGVEYADLHENNLFLFRSGLADLDFTIRFSGAIASSMVMGMVKEGLVSEEAHAAMSLHDWADILRSGWFGEAMHTLAKAPNGLWNDFGRHGGDYWGNSVDVPLRRAGHYIGQAFVYKKVTDSDGVESIAAVVSDPLRQALTKGMRKEKTIGCPVAHHEGTMRADVAETDHNMQRLIAAGHVAITGQLEAHGVQHVRYEQPVSPIDRGLFVFATLLETYADKYGRPCYRNPRDILSKLEHVADERVYPLRTGVVRPVEATAPPTPLGTAGTAGAYSVSLTAEVVPFDSTS